MTECLLANQFNALCESGPPVDLQAFIDQFPQLSNSQLVSILCVDQEKQWQWGNRKMVEDYFQLYPQLKSDTHSALDLIYHEWQLRQELGEQVDGQQYVERFPDLANELKIQAEIDQLIEQDNSMITTSISRATRADSGTLNESAAAARQRDERVSRLRTLPRLPGYRLLEVLGHGGMGIVYLAWHEKLKRKVAVKVVKSTVLNDEAARRRFEAEGRAIARLNQPNIVQIYEVGEHLDQLFLSIEYCAGGSLAQHLNGTPLPVKMAVDICRTISRAIHHAHERGIIHRDLKPANVVLHVPDDQQLSDSAHVLHEAVPKVSDFGLARTAEEAGHTRIDGMLGTPSYMSPEQARNAVEVTRQSDIYSLGAILYELLTGRPPFKATSMIETIHQVLNDEPVPPRQLVPSLPRDLDTICLKALQKEPARRYDTAEDLASDLERFLGGQPVKARPVSRLERVCRWSLRNPGWAVASVSFATMLLVAGFLTWRNIEQAHASIKELQQKQALLEEEQQHTQEEKDKTAAALVSARQSLYSANIAHAVNAWDTLNIQNMDGILEQCPAELRNWEWNYLHSLSERRHQHWLKEDVQVSSIAWQADKQWLATSSPDGRLTIYDYATAKVIHQRKLNASERVKLDFLCTNGRLIYLDAKHSDSLVRAIEGQVNIIDLTNDEQPYAWEPPDDFSISDVVVSHSAGQYAVAMIESGRPGAAGVIKIFDASQPTPVQVSEVPMPGGDCRFIKYSPDGKLLAIAGGDHRVFLMDTQTQQIVDTFEATSERPQNVRSSVSTVDFFGVAQELYEWGINCLAFSWDGKYLAAGMHNGQVRLWNLATKKLTCVLATSNDHVLQLAFSRDNQQLSASSINGVIYVFELPLGLPLATLQGHTRRITGMHYDQAKNILSSSRDGTVRRWSSDDRSGSYAMLGHTRSILSAGFSPDGQTLVTGDGNMFRGNTASTARFWNMQDRTCYRTLQLPCGCASVKLDRSGQQVAIGGGDSKIRIFDQHSDQPQVLSGHSAPLTSLAWHPQANELVSACGSLAFTMIPGEAIVWDLQKSAPRLTLKGHTAALSTVIYSRDGKLIATASADYTVRLWDSQSGESLRVLKDAHEPILTLAIDPHGRWLAAGSGDVMNPMRTHEGRIYIWDLATGQLMHLLRGHNQLVHGMSVTSDGQRLVSCARNDKIRLWDPLSGMELLTLTPTDYACGVYFSPNDQYLAVPNWSGKIDLFAVEPRNAEHQ